MSIIQMNGLTKSYGKFMALQGVDLTVRKGEVFGFVGPNGAGKSTTIKILLGLLRKTSGEVSVFGNDPWADALEIHRKVAYVSSDVTLWPELTGGDVLTLMDNLHKSKNPDRKKELIKRFELDTSKKCRSYSKGNRQKVALIAAFSSDADLFIVDEPTTGLDPFMAQQFRNCVFEAKEDGKTVFLSSHILSEVEMLCDRVGIIRKGEMVETGSLDELRHLTRTNITIELRQDVDLQSISQIKDVRQKENRWLFSVNTDSIETVMDQLAPHGIKYLTAEPQSLEELLFRYYDDDYAQNENMDGFKN